MNRKGKFKTGNTIKSTKKTVSPKGKPNIYNENEKGRHQRTETSSSRLSTARSTIGDIQTNPIEYIGQNILN